MHQDEFLPAVEQVSQGGVLVFSGLVELFLADGIHGVIQIAFDMEMVENYQSVFRMLLDRGDRKSVV